jgi:hypothetical protein
MEKCVVGLLVLLSVPALAAELSLQGAYGKPRGDDFIKAGAGAELQWRTPLGEGRLLALAAGATVHGVNDEPYVVEGGGVVAGVQASGEVTVVPVGASVIFHADSEHGSRVALELGARYLAVDSGVEVKRAAAVTASDLRSETRPVEMDDAVLLVARVETAQTLSESVRLLLSVGYQWDLTRGDLSVGGVKSGEADWSGLFVSAGVGLRW